MSVDWAVKVRVILIGFHYEEKRHELIDGDWQQIIRESVEK